MGCIQSTLEDDGGNKRPRNVGEVAVFLPGLRIPKSIDFSILVHYLPKNFVERLSTLRARIVVIVAKEANSAVKSKRRKSRQHGGSRLVENLQSLEEYLSMLLGLVKDGSLLEDKVEFAWINQEDDAEVTTISNVWYEVLSILHLMAMLCLSEANILLLPGNLADRHQQNVSEEHRRASVDILLKGAGYIDCSIRSVLPRISPLLRTELPIDITEGVLRAFYLQALGQVVDIQLGMAISSPKATLAVKRRLACEMVQCWNQAEDYTLHIPFNNSWSEKHRLFVKWKDVEAKADAYYYHGLILDEGNTEKSHQMAVAALQAAESFLKESKKASEAFHASPPISRSPPPWGSIKYLSEKIPKDASSKEHIYHDLYNHEKNHEVVPSLPDFALALKPDDYQLPPLDPLWNEATKG